MEKHIKTLIPDIYKLVAQTGSNGYWTDELSSQFGSDVAGRLSDYFGHTQKNTLRLSRMGSVCPRALWASIHAPSEAQPLPPFAKIKLAYGHILEAMAITLAKGAGHLVVGEQDELVVDGVLGHRDCVIDGAVVDVKSTTSIGLEKFKSADFSEMDSFGYLDQLDGYIVGSADDPLVTVKDRGYILAIDKQLGHMVLYEHRVREEHIRARIAEYKRISGLPSAPECQCGTRQSGSSGNIELDVRASYSEYKYFCFPHLRTFLYAKGPVFLTHVAKRPMNSLGPIPEIDRYGNRVYH